LFAREALDRSWDRCLNDIDLHRAVERFCAMQIVETSTAQKLEALSRLVVAGPAAVIATPTLDGSRRPLPETREPARHSATAAPCRHRNC